MNIWLEAIIFGRDWSQGLVYPNYVDGEVFLQPMLASVSPINVGGREK